MFQTLPLVFLTAFGLSDFARAQGAVAGPCFQTNFGANLALTDDSVAVGLPLGFNFPKPGGGTTPSISVSSNGFVWLGVNADSGCCAGSETKLLTQMARIAPFWLDLAPDPAAGGAVWFNTFAASGNVPASAVVTWDAVTEYGGGTPVTFQLQMFADGSFVTCHEPLAADPSFYPIGNRALSGVSQGGGAVSNSIDISSAGGTPYDSGTNPSLYETDIYVGFDLGGSVWSYVPNASGGYTLSNKAGCQFAAVSTFGIGCPKGPTIYELFDGTTGIDLSNRALEFTPTNFGGYVVTNGAGFFPPSGTLPGFQENESRPFQLPFTFPYTGGSTNDIRISSEGFIWLQATEWNPRNLGADPVAFFTAPASICGLWMDLDPSAGGSIAFDVVGASEAHITWTNVPETGTTSLNTFQITLRSDGSFRLSWGAVALIGSGMLKGLAGFTEGNVVNDPGSTDLTQAPPLVTSGGGVPLELHAAAGARPRLGTTFQMDVNRIAPGSVLAVLVVGVTPLPGPIDLGAVGMPFCTLYAALDSLQALPLPGGAPAVTIGLPLPLNPALAGSSVQAQAATVTPGATPLNLLSSNGLDLKLGVL
ncbi:MAG: hypothetical protein ACK5AL_00670 [Planctomycetota bacterium]|jgi:hypothetical protein